MPTTSDELKFLSYATVRSRVGEGRCHLLLGNGFSIGCDPVFRYPSLYERAVAAGLSARAKEVFQRLGTNNFEGVMRLLDDADWVARTYGLIPAGPSEMLADVDRVKSALVAAIADSHLDHTGLVPDEKKAAAAAFLSPYYCVFTTNYDLLLYWVIMSATNPPPYGDGFRADPDEPEAEHLLFRGHLGGQKGILFLHGALHLFVGRRGVRKHSWTRSGERLTELVRQGLSQGRYPLFVAEGRPEKKLEQILGSSYLAYCLEKLARIESPLVVFGHSLGEADQHVCNVIADNRKLRELYVGLRGDPESAGSRAIRASVNRLLLRRSTRQLPTLAVHFYNSETANVWGTPTSGT